MKRLLGYLKEHLCVTILAPLFKMLEASFELFVPLVVASMIDVGIGHHDIGYLWKMGGLLILLGIIGFSFSITAQYFAARSAVYTGKSMRSDLFAHMNQFSYQEIDQVGTSTLINRMSNDINQVQNGVNMFLRLFLRSPFVVFGAMFMAFTVDHKAAISFVFTITALAVVVGLILWITMPMYKKVQKQVDGVLKSTRENLLGIRVIRAFNRQRSEEENFRSQSGQLYNKQIHVGKISALLNPLTYMIINLGIIAILWSGGKQVDLGYLTQGQIIALINYMSQILVELVKLANLLIILSRAFASLDRVDQIFALEPSMKETGKTDIEEKKDTPILEFKDTSFVYHGARKETIHPFDFAVKEGETIGVIGGTGSGKSTFVSLIARLYDVTSGRILYRGVDEKELKPEFIRGKIGFVPQKAHLFSGTIEENIRFGKPDATMDEIIHAAKIAQAYDFIMEKPHQFQEQIVEGATNVSGGQKQRLSIARALIRKPEIYIYDDSFSALDFKTDARLRKALKPEIKNAIVFLVAQRVSTILDADKIVVLDEGKIAGIGTHRELLASCPIYYEIAASQLSKEELTYA